MGGDVNIDWIPIFTLVLTSITVIKMYVLTFAALLLYAAWFYIKYKCANLLLTVWISFSVCNCTYIAPTYTQLGKVFDLLVQISVFMMFLTIYLGFVLYKQHSNSSETAQNNVHV